MIKYGMKYPGPIGQLQKVLDQTEEAYADVFQYLTPTVCPYCGESDIEEREDSKLHCWGCGEKIECPKITKYQRDTKYWGLAETYDALVGMIREIVKAIEEAEEPPPQYMTVKQIHALAVEISPSTAPSLKRFQNLKLMERGGAANYYGLLPTLKEKFPKIPWPTQLSKRE